MNYNKRSRLSKALMMLEEAKLIIDEIKDEEQNGFDKLTEV